MEIHGKCVRASGYMTATLSSSILKTIRRQKRLSVQEERDLINRFRDGDRNAATRLILSHLRFVLFVARKYRRYGHPLTELLQEGTVGLLEAVKRFNPEKNVRLSTYAMWWIRASIQDYVVRSRSLVKIGTTRAQKSLFFQIRRRGNRNPSGDSLTDEQAESMAGRFNMSVADVFNLARRMARPDKSLNAPRARDLETDEIDLLADTQPTPEDLLVTKTENRFWKNHLTDALLTLPPREQTIIRRRFFADKAPSRAALAKELGLSKERVRQLEVRALNKLRKFLGSFAEAGPVF